MSAEKSFEGEISSLRARLDELSFMHAEEIGRIRKALEALEGKMRTGSEAMALVSVPEAAGSKEEEMEIFREPAPEVKPVPAEPVSTVATPPEEARGSFELQFGRVWLVRLGIALLVTGLVLLGNYAYRNWIRELPALVRLMFLFISSFGLVAVGWRFTLKEGMRRFGEVVLAGGLAFFYWCTFAAHHVERLQVVKSPVTAGLLLLGAAALIVGVSLKRDARSTAVLGLLLASYSTVLQPLGWLSSVSNVFLAIAGVGLMRRAGWAGPGVASMLGTYAAFLWWQLVGASGGAPDKMGLFFLPASWVVFALPGVAGIADSFRSSLSERGRAWFAAANNGVFFGLFSMLWLMLDYAGYWRVPAVFGAVILMMGSLGRGRESSGSTHVGQGLAMLTLALVLKLDGYQLALGLAMEGLMLAGAFLRFRRPLELAFSVAAQIAAVLMVVRFQNEGAWVFALVALLLAGSAVMIRIGHDRLAETGKFTRLSRAASSLGLAAASVVAIVWSLNLDGPWKLISMELLALGVTVIVMKLDRKHWLPELRFVSATFGVLVACLVFSETRSFDSWVWLTSMLLAGAAGILWEKSERKIVGVLGVPQAWLFSLITAWSLMVGIRAINFSNQIHLGTLAIIVPGLAVIAARILHCPRLRTSISLLLGATLFYSVIIGQASAPLHFLVPISALATLFGSIGGPNRDRIADGVLVIGCRAVALLGWFVAWTAALPDHWLEVLALSGGALMIWQRRVNDWRIPEAGILLAVTAAGLLGTLADAHWGLQEKAGIPDGWGVVAGFLMAGLAQPKSEQNPVRTLLLWLATLVSGLWSTLFVVQSMGWSAVAILWTLLGFGFVCSGLWMRLAAWRHAGFVLLGMALIKLFAVDVWDFGAFTRVLAFIALGVALVVLGFFYNRFAEILKRLLEGDEEPGE
ncbi:DUF2339 domain-containing protein [Haloferula chungangensis]|uniref:DUF2339 domain-containing protein n=1 Tax=Haloferula chungangensis TaxID=1048331 RepID=A0ABW2L7Z9_9BACT